MNPKWLPVVKTKASALFQWLVFEGHKKKYYRASLNLDFGLKNQKIVANEISIDLNEFVQLEIVLTSKIESDKDFLSDFTKRCYKEASSLIKISEQIKAISNFSNLKNDKLLRLWFDYQNAVFSLMPFLNTILVIDGILKKELTAYLEKDLKIGDKKQQDLLLSKLIIPKKKSFFVQETGSLLKIALKLQKDKKANVENDIKTHLKKFSWMSSVAYIGKFQTEANVGKKLNSLVQENPKEKLLLAKKTKREIQERYLEPFQTVKKHNKLVNLIRLAQEFLYLQTYRLDVFFLAHYNVYPLLHEIGRKFGYQVDDLVYLTGKEIVKLFQGQIIDKDEIRRRQKKYALILENDQFTLLSGDDVKQTIQKSIYETEVKGAVANRGRAKGRTKLIFDTKDMAKVKKGNIIVSPMTRPELMPAIVKAAGIVTDFGGILCHAAIISRELGIPCVVGTNNATKDFKDGDMVELNAYEGMARKVNI